MNNDAHRIITVTRSGDPESDREIHTQETLYDVEDDGDGQDSAPGDDVVNPIIPLRGEWFYGCVDRIDDSVKIPDPDAPDDAVPATEFIIDCVTVSWFEGNAPAFDAFYPEGIDDQNLPSFGFVYAPDLTLKSETEMGIHLATLDRYEAPDGSRPNAQHREAVDTLHSEPGRYSVLRWVKQNDDDPIDLTLTEGKWYLFEIRSLDTGPGFPVERIDYTQFEETVPEPSECRIIKVLDPDDETQRRLSRVFSLDFVTEVSITGGGLAEGFLLLPPTGDGDGGDQPPDGATILTGEVDIIGSLFGDSYIPDGFAVDLGKIESTGTVEPTERKPLGDITNRSDSANINGKTDPSYDADGKGGDGKGERPDEDKEN